MHFINISGASTLWEKKPTVFGRPFRKRTCYTHTDRSENRQQREKHKNSFYIWWFFFSWCIPGVVYFKSEMLMLKGHAQTTRGTQRKWKWRMMHLWRFSICPGLISGQELLCIWRLKTTNRSAMNEAVCKTLSWKSVFMTIPNCSEGTQS